MRIEIEKNRLAKEISQPGHFGSWSAPIVMSVSSRMLASILEDRSCFLKPHTHPELHSMRLP